MKPFTTRFLTWFALLIPAQGAEPITVATADGVLNVSTGGQPIFSYRMEPGPLPDGVAAVYAHGAYLHPVFTPSGKLVTADFPPDHRHQRGIFFAWTKTEFEGRHPDFWNLGKIGQPDGKPTAEVRFDRLEKSWGGPESGGFLSQHRFIDHSAEAPHDVLHETWEVTARRLVANGRPANVIDLVSTQTCAGASPLKLPKYHYGGLGVRGQAAWDPVDAVTMLTSNGDDRTKGDATKAKWVYLGGLVDGAPAGMALLIHPGNFRFPQPLRLNPKNPQLCVAPSQDGDWSIEPGQAYTSRYRFVVFDGTPDAVWIEGLWGEYAK